ncbi:bifunctional hydroxymethylpyrimidine kinase/phosphomethylpyrimidine kinase [Corynebacterium sp. TAE3-ERU12]|uniref:bifunctional hydroxymethylpyrimidine kinase/phosphomethylpyrimidine kinase n=1 Tax=Corynebacterium sp. TAE3-ERU12 TaxID=2849491 RepID=UPI001C455E95|nr:bifunctional hydroxymethylpyrimidine kinase/phosphomethylpyrimidine kinase [Corynebacterium sp. TAE3-ERU12]MBV7295788.1 bifunctional hydroxymethylpyrimidine kinase/phosphomethylpyrimidine kinase [Corynebacterium sp. TAE3-ERU12]
MATPIPNILTIAGSDSSGGAGIQADLKSISANGGYGMSAITALTSQNTTGVRGVHVPPASFLREQLDAVTDDVTIAAVKIGMLGTAEVAETVGTWLADAQPAKVVLDPVMVATSGDRLLDVDAESAVLDLLSKADLITPNIPELAVIAGKEPATDWDGVLASAKEVARRYEVHVLAKGGHLHDDTVFDALVTPTGETMTFSAARVDTPNTHGTGCSLSSAVATLWARTGDVATAVEGAKDWLTTALQNSSQLQVGSGSGHGPVHHFGAVWDRGLSRNASAIAKQWWDNIADLRAEIDTLPFVKGLIDGSIDRDDFLWYLEQDALYLNGYSRALAAASTKAPTQQEQMFWAASANESIAAEMDLHRSFIGAEAGAESDGAPEPSAVTRAYVDHLSAVALRGSYGELIAAILPCFWLYRDIGTRFHEVPDPASGPHPFRAWLETYSDEDFDKATDEAISIVAHHAATRATSAERAHMTRAFRLSSWHELEFFDEPVRRHNS